MPNQAQTRLISPQTAHQHRSRLIQFNQFKLACCSRSVSPSLELPELAFFTFVG